MSEPKPQTLNPSPQPPSQFADAVTVGQRSADAHSLPRMDIEKLFSSAPFKPRDWIL